MYRLVALMTAFSMGGCATLFASDTTGVTVTSNPSQAEVWVDGARVGLTPARVELSNSSEHVVIVRSAYGEMSCPLYKSVGAGWVILDVLFGIWPIVIDAITGSWYSLDRSHCHVELQGSGQSWSAPPR